MSPVYFKKGALHDIDLHEAMVNKDYAIYDHDSFVKLENTFGNTVGGYAMTADAGGAIALVGLAPGTVVAVNCDGDDNDALIMQRQGSAAPFSIELNSGKEVAFEAKMAIVSGGEVGVFIGLAEAGLDQDILVDDTGAIQDKDVIGFHAAAHATDVDVDGIYRIEGGSAVTGADTMTEDDDGEYNTYGFRFDGKTTITWYLDDAEVGTSTLTAATFPSDEALTFTFAIKTGEAAEKAVRIDDWTCVQLV